MNNQTSMVVAAITTTNNAASMDIANLIRLHECHHRHNTRAVNQALLRQLSAFVGHPLTIGDITETFCIDFADFLTHRVALTSARTYLQKFHALLEHAVAIHLMYRNPMPAIKDLLPRVTAPHRRAYLLSHELSLLTRTACPHPETKRAFLFACQTGLRLSDVETLTWDDIVDVDGTPTIVKVQVKTGHEVRIPLNQVAQQLLLEKSGAGRVFHLPSRSIISTDLRRWALSAGVRKRLTFHVSRHTFATLSISAGVDIYVVSRLCGHTTVRTTEIYAHMIDKTLQQGVERLGAAMLQPMKIPAGTRKYPLHIYIKRALHRLVERPKNKIYQQSKRLMCRLL